MAKIRLSDLLLLLPLACAALPAQAAAPAERRIVSVAAADTPAFFHGRLRGRQDVDYIVTAQAGQTLSVRLKATNRATFFNVLPPASEEALFIGSGAATPDQFSGLLPHSGDYRIRLYLMRNAARRGEGSRYTLEIRSAPAAAQAAPINGPDLPGRPTRLDSTGQPFAQTLRRQGIEFQVSCSNGGSLNTLRIAPRGLEIDNSPVEREIDGSCTGAEVDDLDVDGSPEIYVYINSAGSGSYGSLVAYAANRRKSLSEIVLPPLEAQPGAMQGYQGHDEFAVMEGTFNRRFPIYRAGDRNAQPSGGMRQLQYKLVPGEAAWQLRFDRLVEY